MPAGSGFLNLIKGSFDSLASKLTSPIGKLGDMIGGLAGKLTEDKPGRDLKERYEKVTEKAKSHFEKTYKDPDAPVRKKAAAKERYERFLERPSIKSAGERLGTAQKFAGAGSAAEMLGAKETGGKLQSAAKAMTGDPIAIAKLVKDQMAAMHAGFKGAGRETKAMVGSERAGETAGHGLRAVGSAFGGMGMAGEQVEKQFKFAAAVVESVDKLRDFSQGLHDANMKFAEFSGAMAKVQAQQEVRDILLSQQRGDRRAKSADILARGKHELEQTMTPTEDLWARAKNDMVGIFDRGLARTLEATGWNRHVVPVLSFLLTLVESGGADEGLFTEAELTWARNHGRPRRFGP